MNYEVRIGLEIHLQLKTSTKMFCSCKNDYNFEDEPNTNICPVCLGYPGSLPVPNRKAVEHTLKLAKALSCRINYKPVFYRKNYFYPDLPKGYQITQYGEGSIAHEGKLFLRLDKQGKYVRIARLSLEEDTARSIQTSDGNVLLDFNRSGIPLVEIVTYPDMESPEEAKAFLENLRLLIMYLDISDADMEKGHFRVDVNVSVLGNERVEIKNVNSIREVVNALEYEIQRQKDEISKGKTIQRHTRMWDDISGITRPMRRKEAEKDYRYFPEPDIPMLNVMDYKVHVEDDPYTAFSLLLERNVDPNYAETIVRNIELWKRMKFFLDKDVELKEVAKLLVNVISSMDSYPEAEQIFKLIVSGLPRNVLKEAVKQLEYKDADSIVEELLGSLADENDVEEAVKRVIENNRKQYEEYIQGKKNLFGFFMGQVRKELRNSGKEADPKLVKEVLSRMLEGH